MAIDNKILSIDYDDDDKDIAAFNEYLEEDTKRKKNKTVLEFEQMGKQYLKEIDKKKKQKELMKTKLIPYIIKKSKGKYDNEDFDELTSYSFEDIQDIYNQVKAENRLAISKFFHFFFNIE
jgi:hypothetical protein